MKEDRDGWGGLYNVHVTLHISLRQVNTCPLWALYYKALGYILNSNMLNELVLFPLLLPLPLRLKLKAQRDL